jgi:hypothetical protein
MLWETLTLSDPGKAGHSSSEAAMWLETAMDVDVYPNLRGRELISLSERSEERKCRRSFANW